MLCGQYTKVAIMLICDLCSKGWHLAWMFHATIGKSANQKMVLPLVHMIDLDVYYYS
jgi:hypothetical protein